MVKTKQEIISDIKNHIGSNFNNWYIGIAADPRQRLFVDHNVDEKNGSWIFREAQSSNEARDTEIYLIDKLGTKGDSGGGDNTTKFVYAYRITSTTRE
jgi:hypothetical protein